MASIDLDFGQAPLGPGSPVEIVFGDDDGGAPSGTGLLHIAGRITGLRGHVPVRTLVRAHVAGTITGLRGHLPTHFDINVSRPMVGRTGNRWHGAAPVQQGVRVGWQRPAHRPAAVRSHWQDAAPLAACLQLRWENTQRLSHDLRGVFEQALRLHAALLRASHEEARRLALDTLARHQEATRLPTAALHARHQDAWRDRRLTARARHQIAAHLGEQIAGGMGLARPLQRTFGGRYQQAWPPRPGQWQRPALPGNEPCYLPVLPAHLVFGAPWTGDGHLVFVCERHGQGPEPEPGVVVPVRKVYIVLNNITLHRVDTGAELHAHSFGMSLDHQSWTWSWQASLHHDAAAHLGRDSQGDPAEMAILVNGLPFRLRLERVARDRRFNPTRWSVSGKGKAAILSAPYAPAMQFGNPGADRTAQQLMADVLTINGVGMGWMVDWGLQDWLVPAGAWTLQGSYIDAINDIAGAAGGYVQPHPTDAILRILPSYPAAPWAWDSVAPDFEIPADAAEVEGSEYIDQPGYNRVFVGGVGAGVFGPFKRTGTAGDVLAPQVTHALITDAVAHRQRGLAELSNTGRQEHITLNMQVLPETGVIVPGQFVRYLGDKSVMGIVRSTSIDWSFPKLRQTIKLETHV